MAYFALIVERVKSGAGSLHREVPKMLAFVARLQDVAALNECKAQAAAVAAYLAQRKDGSVEEYNAALKVKVRIESRLGEVLAATVLTRGQHGSGVNGSTKSLPKEITAKQSSRAQQLARIPWTEIEVRIDACTERNERARLARIIKELMQEQQRADNRRLVEVARPLADHPGVFQTIVVDPPWDWDDEGDASQFGRGRHEYQALTFAELLRLPVAGKASRDCHLYLWTTNRSLPKGFALVERWGFRYVTCLTWCKPSFGMGNYFRGSTEHVLFGVRGSLPLLRKDVGTWFAATRAGRHSTKPPEFFRMIEECSPGPWLELFARQLRPGWVSWGAEA